MSLSDYKRRQMEYENNQLPAYNLQPVQQTPAEQYYSEHEYAVGLALCRELLPLANVTAALICGIGAGADLRYWLQNLRLGSAVGLDLASEAIRAVQRMIELNDLPRVTRFARADFESMPFKDNAFDLGIIVHSLHHAETPALAFRELWRVSRRGVLLIEPAATFTTSLFARLGLAKDTEEVGNKVIRFRPHDFLDWVGEPNVRHKSQSYFHYYHPLIYRRVLPLFDYEGGQRSLRLFLQAANVLLFPLRSKIAMALIKNA